MDLDDAKSIQLAKFYDQLVENSFIDELEKTCSINQVELAGELEKLGIAGLGAALKAIPKSREQLKHAIKGLMTEAKSFYRYMTDPNYRKFMNRHPEIKKIFENKIRKMRIAQLITGGLGLGVGMAVAGKKLYKYYKTPKLQRYLKKLLKKQTARRNIERGAIATGGLGIGAGIGAGMSAGMGAGMGLQPGETWGAGLLRPEVPMFGADMGFEPL